ncbi:glycoside hydrolase family 97 catalytic domain-containing protein [Candidatus Sumerlaeota bacterium]|nr:glycoside hydrolase family 97 catalytic domain-containing protein [Candidatus Sumerlaeota bacterium]
MTPATVLGTRCQELALFIVYESTLTCVCDHPKNYANQPGADFLKIVPTTWDETIGLNGELDTKYDPASGGSTTTFRYDPMGSLLDVDVFDGASTDSVNYTVDVSGRRFLRDDGATSAIWVYQDRLNPVAQLDSAGKLDRLFIYGSSGHVPDLMFKDGVAYRLITDHLGSVRLVVRLSDGAVMQRIDYDPWGVTENDTNSGFQPFGYAGGHCDVATSDIIRFGARDYDAKLGRWLARAGVRRACCALATTWSASTTRLWTCNTSNASPATGPSTTSRSKTIRISTSRFPLTAPRYSCIIRRVVYMGIIRYQNSWEAPRINF